MHRFETFDFEKLL